MTNAEQIQEATMSRRQAWKAFRIGVIASGRRFPLEGQEAQDFWRRMRSRFNEWYEQYLRAQEQGIERVTGKADLGPDPFNSPRLTVMRKARAR